MIFHVNFQDQTLTEVEEVEEKEEKLDPVLERIKNKVDPKTFEVYKKTIEHYWQECFLYQMEEMNGVMYDPEEAAKWEE